MQERVRESKMQYNKIFGFLIVLSILTALPLTGAEKSCIQGVKLPPVRSFDLSNGTKVFVIRDELPKITLVASVGFGSLYENSINAGISQLISSTLSLAGSKKYPGQVLHEKIESIGGKVSVHSSFEGTVISVKVLGRYRNDAYDILSDLIKNPNFDEKYIEIARSLFLERIKRKNDDPASVAIDNVKKIVFQESCYGAVPTKKSISSITRKMMIHAWDKYFRGSNIQVAVSSPLDFESVKAFSEKLFSGWPEGNIQDYHTDINVLKRGIAENKDKIFVIHRNIPQATVVAGLVAPAIHDKGNYALSVMNYILGGGSFNSRLMTEIRVKRGLAYVVQSIIRFRKNTGIYLAFAQTGNSNAAQVLSLIQENLDKIAEENVSEKELHWAKEAICNSYIFRFDTLLNILGNYLSSNYNGLPADYFEKYTGNIKDVSRDEIRKTAGAFLGSGYIRLVVGKPGIEKELGKLGEIVIIDEDK